MIPCTQIGWIKPAKLSIRQSKLYNKFYVILYHDPCDVLTTYPHGVAPIVTIV